MFGFHSSLFISHKFPLTIGIGAMIDLNQYSQAENIYNFLVEPYAQAVKEDGLNRRMIFTALHETFITYLKVAFFAAIFVSSPIVLTQIWKFIAPGLYKNEKKALLPYLIATPTLFLLGGMLVYYFCLLYTSDAADE